MMRGRKFTYWTLLERCEPNEHNQERWLCVCKCGKQRKVQAGTLLSGRSKSCGCWQVEHRKPSKPRLEPEEVMVNDLLGVYQRNAKKRGHIFRLTLDDFGLLLKGNCRYCKRVPEQVRRYKRKDGSFELLYSGIDRKDNSKGYTKENCVSCCGICNRMKGPMSDLEFLAHIKRIGETML